MNTRDRVVDDLARLAGMYAAQHERAGMTGPESLYSEGVAAGLLASVAMVAGAPLEEMRFKDLVRSGAAIVAASYEEEPPA